MKRYKNKWDFIGKCVRSCKIFLIFCSKNSINLESVEEEWHVVRELNKNIIPVFNKLDNVPALLRKYTGVQFNPEDLNKTIKEIFEVIKTKFLKEKE
ncbi:MAG: TIR domain-containing protein [Promethearchaeota archaeon]